MHKQMLFCTWNLLSTFPILLHRQILARSTLYFAHLFLKEAQHYFLFFPMLTSLLPSESLSELMLCSWRIFIPQIKDGATILPASPWSDSTTYRDGFKCKLTSLLKIFLCISFFKTCWTFSRWRVWYFGCSRSFVF